MGVLESALRPEIPWGSILQEIPHLLPDLHSLAPETRCTTTSISYSSKSHGPEAILISLSALLVAKTHEAKHLGVALGDSTHGSLKTVRRLSGPHDSRCLRLTEGMLV